MVRRPAPLVLPLFAALSPVRKSSLNVAAMSLPHLFSAILTNSWRHGGHTKPKALAQLRDLGSKALAPFLPHVGRAGPDDELGHSWSEFDQHISVNSGANSTNFERSAQFCSEFDQLFGDFGHFWSDFGPTSAKLVNSMAMWAKFRHISANSGASSTDARRIRPIPFGTGLGQLCLAKVG